MFISCTAAQRNFDIAGGTNNSTEGVDVKGMPWSVLSIGVFVGGTCQVENLFLDALDFSNGSFEEANAGILRDHQEGMAQDGCTSWDLLHIVMMMTLTFNVVTALSNRD